MRRITAAIIAFALTASLVFTPAANRTIPFGLGVAPALATDSDRGGPPAGAATVVSSQQLIVALTVITALQLTQMLSVVDPFRHMNRITIEGAIVPYEAIIMRVAFYNAAIALLYLNNARALNPLQRVSYTEGLIVQAQNNLDDALEFGDDDDVYEAAEALHWLSSLCYYLAAFAHAQQQES
ncbi:MAG: hypothetical protein RIE31_12080 [Alphaproteobacteria bacterium]